MMFKNFFEVARVIVCAFVAVGLVKLTEWGIGHELSTSNLATYATGIYLLHATDQG